MDTSAQAKRFRLRQEDLHWREVGDEIVVLSERDQTYIGINETGSALWHLLAGGASHEELVENLLSKFDVGRHDATRDVDDFLSDAVAEGLVEPATES